MKLAKKKREKEKEKEKRKKEYIIKGRFEFNLLRSNAFKGTKKKHANES